MNKLGYSSITGLTTCTQIFSQMNNRSEMLSGSCSRVDKPHLCIGNNDQAKNIRKLCSKLLKGRFNYTDGLSSSHA